MQIFKRHEDYEVFLAFLKRAAAGRHVSLHAFVLMTTHVHLIATPHQPASLSKMMQELGVHYVRYFNRHYERTGTMWNDRYKAFLLDTEAYWLTCLRYVEQNPVRAGMVKTPADYPWSSYPAHAFGRWSDWLVPHHVYSALGRTSGERQEAYRSLCSVLLTEDQMAVVSDTPPTPAPVRYNSGSP
jgi:putative transposase